MNSLISGNWYPKAEYLVWAINHRVLFLPLLRTQNGFPLEAGKKVEPQPQPGLRKNRAGHQLTDRGKLARPRNLRQQRTKILHLQLNQYFRLKPEMLHRRCSSLRSIQMLNFWQVVIASPWRTWPRWRREGGGTAMPKLRGHRVITESDRQV